MHAFLKKSMVKIFALFTAFDSWIFRNIDLAFTLDKDTPVSSHEVVHAFFACGLTGGHYQRTKEPCVFSHAKLYQ